MLMVVVGAGASYGCRDSFSDQPGSDNNLGVPYAGPGQWRPPLTTELFDERQAFTQVVQRYGASRGLMLQLRQQLDGDDPRPLEQLLAEVTSEESPSRLRELMAIRCYLQHVLYSTSYWVRHAGDGATYYDQLVSTIASWSHRSGNEVTFVSFNYDLLIDEAIRHIYGLQPDPEMPQEAIGRYLANDHVQLIKPHGSVNWWRAMEAPEQFGTVNSRDLIAVAPELTPRGQFKIMERPPNLMPASNEAAWVPVLGLPIYGKQDYAAPDEHMRYFRDLEGKVTSLLIIGWRALEPHFLPHLKQVLTPDAEALICDSGEDSCTDIATRLQGELGLQEEPRCISDGFSHLVRANSSSGASALSGWLESRHQPG